MKTNFYLADFSTFKLCANFQNFLNWYCLFY